MTEIPDAAVDAALREYFRGWQAEESWLTARRGEMTRAIAAADKARGIGGLPVVPSDAAFEAARRAYDQAAVNVYRRRADTLYAALIAAYAIDGARTAPPGDPSPVHVEYWHKPANSMERVVTDSFTINTTATSSAPFVVGNLPCRHEPAPSSALRAILRRFQNVSMEPGGFACSYVRNDELTAALAELDAMERR